MSDDKLKHKPQAKHTLSEVLKSLQDLIRNDLVPAKNEPPASAESPQPATSPPAHETDSFHDAIEQLDEMITHKIIEPVERARETPPEPLLPDEEIEIEWGDDAKTTLPDTETIEATAPPALPEETIELTPVEPIPDVELKLEDAPIETPAPVELLAPEVEPTFEDIPTEPSEPVEIEVELAPPPPDVTAPAPEPVEAVHETLDARTDDAEPSESIAPPATGAQEEFPFAEPRAEETSLTLDLAAAEARPLEDVTVTLETSTHAAITTPAPMPVDIVKAAAVSPSKDQPVAVSAPKEIDLENRATPAVSHEHRIEPSRTETRTAATPRDSSVIEWESPSLVRATAPQTPPPKTSGAPAGATQPVAPKTPAPATTTPPSKTMPAEPPKRPEPARVSPPSVKPPQRIPEVKQPMATERTPKPAPPSKPAPTPAKATPAQPTPPVKAPPGAANPPAPSAPKPPSAVKPADAPKPAPKPAAPERTEIPVLKEIAEVAALSTVPLPEPAQARDIAIRVIARLNIERRKSGETPLDIKTIERLQQYLADALAKRALNKPD